MCGIVGFIGKDKAAPFLLEGLSRLEYRGYDSAGVAVLNSGNGELELEKTIKRINCLAEETENGFALKGNLGIGHTRWATHGEPSYENAHPQLSQNGKFAVVHNGIIENYSELKTELIAKGVSFISDTDTEVIPQLIAEYYDGDFPAAVSAATSRLKGSYALGIICSDYPDTLIAVRKFSPLIIGICEDKKLIASDITAVISHTRQVIYLEDGELAVITPENIKIYNECIEEIKKKITEITWDIDAAEKSGYDHFMMKEICEQPRAIVQTIESRIKNNEIVFEGIKLNKEKLKNINRIVILACGSAYYAGMVGKYVFEELLRTPTEVDLASEFRYRNPIIDNHTLTIVISQSGETADTLAALNESKRLGSHILSIVNVVGSSIAKASDDVIYTWAGPEIAVATTKGYSAQLAVIYMLAVWAAKQLKTVPDTELYRILSDLCRLPDAIQTVINQKDKIKEMTKNFTNDDSVFFIGRNLDFAVALEASLKLKEISYIHSEAYASGELKHGTISLIEKDKTVIALCCCEKLFEKQLSNIKEVKARGAYVISCALEENTAIESESDEIIYVPKLHPLLQASIEVIPFQLYAYYVALSRGCDIDKPRNLAKSVTVE